MRMTIAKKLGLTFGIVILLMAINPWIAQMSLDSINKRLNEIVDVVSIRQLLAKQIQHDMLSIHRAEKNLILESRPEEMDKYAAAIDKYETEMKEKIEKLNSIATPEGKKHIAELEKLYNDWKKIDLEVQKLSRETADIKAADLSAKQGRILFDKIEAEASHIVEINDKKMIEATEISDRNYASATNLLWVVLILALLISTAASFFIIWSITKPLGRVVSGMIAGSAGDLTATILVKSNDELGDLAGSFNKMIGGLKTMVAQVKEAAERAASFSQQLASQTQEMNATTEEVSSTVQQIATSSSKQAEGTEMTSKIIEDISTTVKENVSAAQAAAAASLEATQKAQAGGKAARKTVEKMGQIASVINESAGSVRSLKDSSQQIGQIVEVITGFANQTNLLSLNAAIEAARAGESGRGFAVVAEEVRKLAEGSKKSAQEIADLIAKVQAETEKTVASIDSGSKEVTEGMEVVKETALVFEEIIKGVEETGAISQQVASASQQIVDGTEKIVKAMEEISAAAEENASAVQEVSASTEEQTASMEEMASPAQELSDMAIKLAELTAKFKVGGDKDDRR